MKKVMFLIYSLGSGGAERVLLDTVNHLNQEKYEITLQTLFDEKAFSNQLREGIRYRTVFSVKKTVPQKILSGFVQYLMPASWVYRLFFKDDYDVEVAFMEAFPTKMIGSSTNKKAKKYAWVHIDVNTYKKQDRLFRSLKAQKKCYEKFDGIYCVSEGVRQEFIKKFGISEKTGVAYNILNEEFIQQKKKEFPVLRSGKQMELISIGSLIPRKGFERLIKVCSRLKAEGYLFHLRILGKGELEESLKKMISDEDLENEAELTGFCANPYPYMAASDLYVCPSYVEGFSTVVSEAVILGLPVVTTECSGMKEILGESEYGLITENTEEALYEGMKKILSDKKCFQHYQEKVRERADFFKMKTRIREYEKILDQ